MFDGNHANLNNVYSSNATLGLFVRGPRWELVPSAPRVWWLRLAAPPPPVCSGPRAIPMSTSRSRSLLLLIVSGPRGVKFVMLLFMC